MTFFCNSRLCRLIADYFRSFRKVYCEVPVRKYLISDDDEYDDTMTRVPEDSIYVEEWERNGEFRRRLLYEGQEIAPYDGDPFKSYKTPWLWIGDTTTGVDLTEAVGRYLMPGNTIALDLLFRFIRCTTDTSLMYVDPRTMEPVCFPADGVKIEANEYE
jgi:hypothetical protein